MRELDVYVDVFVWIVATTFFAIVNTTDGKHLRSLKLITRKLNFDPSESNALIPCKV